MSEYILQALHAVRQRRAEITAKKQHLEIEDRELAVTERTLLRLSEGDPPVLGEGAPGEPVQAELPVEIPLRRKPPRLAAAVEASALNLGPTPADDDIVTGVAGSALMVDAATLPPLTPLQFKVFSAIVAARGQYISAADIDANTGSPGSYGSLQAVRGKGYIRAIDASSKHNTAYEVVCFGTPRVAAHGSGPYRDYQTGPIVADTVVEAPVSLGPITTPGETVRFDEIPPGTSAGDGDPASNADEKVDMDDLSKSQRDVLCVIVELSEDAPAAPASDVLTLSGLDQDRLVSVLTRLSQLGCITMVCNAPPQWKVTPLGAWIASEIKRDELE